MSSPENNKPTPKSPLVQDSPFSTYLGNLSPLKTVESRPGTAPYAYTSFPTPEPVFTSPHLTRVKRSSRGEKISQEKTFMAPFAGKMVKFAPVILKKCSVEPYIEQSCSSPPTCIDEFLADPSENGDDLSRTQESLIQAVELALGLQGESDSSEEDQLNCLDDSVKSSMPTGLPDLNTEQATALEETSEKIAVSDVKKCVNSKAFVLSSSYMAEEEPTGDESSDLVPIGETRNNLKMVDKAVEVNESSLDAHLKLASKIIGSCDDSSIVPTSSVHLDWSTVGVATMDHSSFMGKEDGAYHGKENPNNSNFSCQVINDGKMHQVETVQGGGLNYSPQLQPESLQGINAGDDDLDVLGVTFNTSAENYSPFDQEDGAQHTRGMRKRLQFEAVEHCRISAGHETNPWVFTTDESNVYSPAYSLNSELVNVPNRESNTATHKKQLIDSIPGTLRQKRGSLPVTVPRAHGFGLYLNSVGGPINSNVNVQFPVNNVCIQGNDLLSGCNDQEQQSQMNCIASKSLSSDNFSIHSATENIEEKLLGDKAAKASNSQYQSSQDVKPLSQLRSVDQSVTPCSGKKRPLEEVNRTELSQRSPRKKRQLKKAENEGCKRCNCKRSKCLKLYCDCFAAGVFCSDGCACQGCYNKPEHENTVRETQQLIESRNPLAFAPKVVVRATVALKDTGDSQRVTPTSARHKRGCNCKKSLCLKKYCECFQAGVGCSLGCRCDGCMNSFGRKDGDEIIETLEKIGLERDPGGNLECREVKKQYISIEHCHSRLTPFTPLFQGSKRNDAAKSRLPARYYPSPESGASVSPSYESPNSPMDSISSTTFAKETEGSSSLVPHNHELRCHTTGQADPFSPGWDRFPDICNLSPLPNPSLQGSSVASAAPRPREPKTLHAKLFHGSGRVSSLYWQSSPVTPLPQLGESKIVMELDSESGMHQYHDDDTPEILKDICPINAVKASSPNQKRVSPPHRHLNEMRPNPSSPATRNGRKFILKSVPSFPPLTPYSNNTRRHDT